MNQSSATALPGQASTQAPARRRSRLLTRGRVEPILSVLLLIALLGLWYYASAVMRVPAFILPPLGDVSNWLTRGFTAPFGSPLSLWYHMAVTAKEALYGFIIGSTVGIVLGMTNNFHWNRKWTWKDRGRTQELPIVQQYMQYAAAKMVGPKPEFQCKRAVEKLVEKGYFVINGNLIWRPR